MESVHSRSCTLLETIKPIKWVLITDINALLCRRHTHNCEVEHAAQIGGPLQEGKEPPTQLPG